MSINVFNVAQAREWQVESPNGQLQLSLRYLEETGLQYQLRKEQTQTLIDWSRLSLGLSWPEISQEQKRTSIDFNGELVFLARVDQDINETYTLLHGKRFNNHYVAQESRFLFQHRSSKKQLRLDIQLADDGLAFRYALPEVNSLSHWIEDEISEFNIVNQQQYWAQPFAQDDKGRFSYQSPYVLVSSLSSKQDSAATSLVSSTKKQEVEIAMPALVKANDHTWVLLHESNLDDRYHGSHLNTTNDGRFKIMPPASRSAQALGADHAVTTLPTTLPWRFLIISDDLADIVENNRVFDLANESELSNTDWIQAGLASWSAQSNQQNPSKTSKLRDLIKLAAQMEWPYSLIDSGWQDLGDKKLTELAAYASKRSIGLGLWYHSGSKGNIVSTDATYIMNQPQLRKAEFRKLQTLGIRYIKVDLFDGDKQIIIQQYLDILKDAADHELMVVFNGSTVPRGWARTYPNLMTMEAVRGGEFYASNNHTNNTELAANQSSILPFTRNAVGSMNFAPIVFSKSQTQFNSNAHEAALGVLFESGLQHMPDKPSSYRKLNGSYKEYLKNLPAAWDETHFLSGYPGKDIVIARRSANTWYVAGINGEMDTKQLEFSLDFLSSNLHRDLAKSAILISDANTPTEFNIGNFEIGAASRLSITVAPAGGFVMIIRLDQDQ